MQSVLVLATVALCAPLVATFSSRPFRPGSFEEQQACSTLIPLHGPVRQPPNSAFTLTANRLGNNNVQVTLSGQRKFKGFIIQSSGPAGEFSFGGDAIKVGCSQATVRHSGPALKDSVQVTFKPKASGTVTFKGTVVEDYMDFYELAPVSA